jgi:ribosome maturation factor RimP
VRPLRFFLLVGVWVSLEARHEVRQLAQTLADEEGFELVDVEFLVQGGRRVLRVLLDRPGGIRVGDCAAFSRRISDCLDMNQTIQGRYSLEVSSPGIERPLTSLAALHRFAGQRASITSVQARDGRRHFEGEILAPDGERAGLRTDDGQEHWFEWNDLKDAHLVVDPWAARKREGGRS